MSQIKCNYIYFWEVLLSCFNCRIFVEMRSSFLTFFYGLEIALWRNVVRREKCRVVFFRFFLDHNCYKKIKYKVWSWLVWLGLIFRFVIYLTVFYWDAKWKNCRTGYPTKIAHLIFGYFFPGNFIGLSFLYTSL